jgi:hypothetical protein
VNYSIEAVRPSTGAQVTLLPRVLMSALALAFMIAGLGLFIQHIAILQTWRPVEAKIVRSDVIEFRNKAHQRMYRGEIELAYSLGEAVTTFAHAYRIASQRTGNPFQ